jgi:hypothetical protein
MYAHIQSKLVRRVIAGNGRPCDIGRTLAYSARCVAADMNSEWLDGTVIDARVNAYNAAADTWQDKRDAAATVAHLRALWLGR